MKTFLMRWLITTIAVATAAHLTGMIYDSLSALMIVALLLGIVNALVRPVLLLMSLPFIVLSLGLFILVVNALLMWLVAELVPGFHITGFGQAFFGALIVSIVNWILSAFFHSGDSSFRGSIRVSTHRPGPAPEKIKPVQGRVIE